MVFETFAMSKQIKLTGVPPARNSSRWFCEHVAQNLAHRQPTTLSDCGTYSVYDPTTNATVAKPHDTYDLSRALAAVVINDAAPRPWPRNFNLDTEGYCRHFEEYVSEATPKTAYQAREKGDEPPSPAALYNTHRTTCTWPLRKALLMDTEFLLKYTKGCDDKVLVLYIHISDCDAYEWLKKRFGDSCEFVYVTGQNDNEATEAKQMRAARARCQAARARGQRVLLIDNAPRARHDNESVSEIMYDQQKSMDFIAPDFAFLRFRLPFARHESETFMYPSGKVMLPLWGRHSSTETKIIVARGAPETQYNLQDFEDKMFHHNKITRKAIFHRDIYEATPHVADIIDCPSHEYCNCYDCVREIRILVALTRRMGVADSDVSGEVLQLFHSINAALCKDHGIKNNSVFETRA